MAEKTITAVKARVHFGEIMKKAYKRGERFIVEKSDIPMVAILSIQDYQKLTAKKKRTVKKAVIKKKKRVKTKK